MDGKKVRINVRDAVMAVLNGSRGRPGSIDVKTFRKVLQALRKGDWKIRPSARRVRSGEGPWEIVQLIPKRQSGGS